MNSYFCSTESLIQFKMYYSTHCSSSLIKILQAIVDNFSIVEISL